MRRLAGLGGPWRPKKHTQTTTGLPYAAAWCAKCVFSAVSKPASLGSTSQRFLSRRTTQDGAQYDLIELNELALRQSRHVGII